MNKNVIITGASKGIGKAIAFAFAKEGYSLMLGARNLSDLTATKKEILSRFPDATIWIKSLDFSDKNAVADFVKQSQQIMPEVDIIVNNVGQYAEDMASDFQPELLDNMMKVNFYSAYHLTLPLLNKMKEHRQGHIFNILSIASIDLVHKASSYSISKYAFHGWHKLLQNELKPFKIKVTGIFPGSTISDSWKNENIDPTKFIKAEDIAGIVIQASKLPPHVNMEDIVVRPTNS